MARVAVIGAGAVGCYYGALLARAGHDVRFLMRRDLAAVRAGGLEVRSPRGDFRLTGVTAFGTPTEIGPVEWVVCSLKTTALEAARGLIEPCMGEKTRLVALMNGLGVEERLAAWFGRERLFGGMAFVCVNRGTPGVVHHLEYGRVSIGHLPDDPAETERLRALLASAGIEVSVAASLRQARWEKLCWNVPFNGLSVAGGGIGTAVICGDAALRATAERAMREVVAIGNADLAASGSNSRIDEEETVAWLFRQTETMGDYRTSMAIDYLLGRELEVEAILGEVARRAEALGVAAPTVAAVYALVALADRRRRGEVPVIVL
ncbi:MAG: 2-dehydropantoate 2-reductase [Gemmataceae bacterium]|nr:2-dehydropantoate 2-reductase [Gemmataceae bacterium]